ncbi:uncharacterized protein LOC133364994 [Rhineura floridana]|uniref:uncharacterized protein LOC133364994 n=1 Tax=Rhineura floridana TaxID=261503 RepID=UPI002AC8925D|nr:uncharacterized protein LOC133364994 [Rhineura floridana]
MGCCFSKELNSKNEKMSLLQKSTEEEFSENGISKTLTSILENMEGKELYVIQEKICGEAATCNNSMESVKYPSGHCVGIAEGGHITSRSFNVHQYNMKRALNRYDSLQECELTEGTVDGEKLTENSNSDVQCVNNADGHHINSNSETGSTVAGKRWCSCENTSTSCVPVALSQGNFFPKALSTYTVKDNLDMGKCLLAQDEAETSKSNCSVIGSSSVDRETAASTFAYLDIDRHDKCNRDEFYSICVVDDLGTELEEGQDIVYGGCASDVKKSAVQEMYSMTCPVESGKQFVVQKPAQIPVDFSVQKDACSSITEDSIFMPKNEIEIKSSIELVIGDHRLNTDSIAADVLRAQAHGEELTKNRTQEMDMLDSSRIFVNESLSENNNSPTPVHLEKDIQYSVQLKSRRNTCSSTFSNENNCDAEAVKSESNENQNTKEENMSLGNSKFSSEFEKTAGDFLFVSENNTENLSQGNRQDLESQQNFTGNTNEFWTVSASIDKKTPNFSEQRNLELLLKYDVSHLETFCYHGNLAEGPIKMLPTSNSVAFEAEISHVSEFSSYEGGSYIRAARHNLTQIDNIPSYMSGLRRGSWGSENTTFFSDPLNVNEYERIQNENCLEVQLPPNLLKKDSKTSQYSSSFNEENSCCVSLAHSEASEMDLNDKHCELWEKCTFHRLEDQLSAGTDSHNLIATVEEPVNGLKCGKHHEKTHSEMEAKPNSENAIVCESCVLNSSNVLMQKHSKTSNVQKRAVILEEALSILQIDRANSQLEIERLPASVDENYARSVKAETDYTETSTRSRGGNSGFYKNSSSPEQSVLETVCPLTPLISEVSTPYADRLTENTKESAPQNCQHKFEIECASRTNPKDTVTCTDAGGICIDPSQVDKYAATPSYEISPASVNDQESDQGSAKHVLDLMEDILKESDNTHKMDIRDFHDDPLCQSAPLSKLFPAAKFTDDQEYLMGYLWINSSSNKTTNSCTTSETVQNEAGDLPIPPIAIGGYPYQLLVQQSSDIWGWQDQDEMCWKVPVSSQPHPVVGECWELWVHTGSSL